MKRNTLNIQAEGLNELNRYTIDILQHIIPQLKNLIGVKILTQSGKSKKWNVTGYKKENAKSEGKHISYNYYLDFSHNTVKLRPKICINGGSYEVQPSTAYCEYFEDVVYIGELQENDNTILSKVEEVETIIKNYHLEQTFSESELSDMVKQFEAAKNAARDAYNKIPSTVKKAKFLSY